MDCYPPCVTCTGLCQKETKRPVQSRKRKKKPAQTLVSPPRLPDVIVLICGDFTTWKEQVQFFRAQGRMPPRSATYRTKFWCPKHGHYVKPYTFARKIDNTNIPLPF